MQSLIQRQNLSVYWKLEESGATATDSSPTSNDGTVTTATVIQNGRFGKAKNFNSGGTDKVVSNSNVALGTSPFTIILWFKKSTDSTTRGMIATDATDTGETFISVRWSDAATDKISFYTATFGGTNVVATTSKTYADSRWHQLICTRDASGVNRIYVDGALEATTSAKTESINTAKIRIGNREAGVNTQEGAAASFKGDLDEFALYIGEAFSSAKIKRLFSALKGPRMM